MAQYIDKSALVAEIERLKSAAETMLTGKTDLSYWKAQKHLCKRLLSFLDTLEVEEVGEFVSNDLEEEITRCIVDEDMNFAEVARHFAQWQKQQLMKDAVDAVVLTGAVIVEREIMNKILKHLGLKTGDKFKLIIIKA